MIRWGGTRAMGVVISTIGCVMAGLLTGSTLLRAQTPGPSPGGDALFAKQDWAGAAKEFQRVTEQDPKNGRAWFRLGTALQKLNKSAEARQAFERAIENHFQAP